MVLGHLPGSVDSTGLSVGPLQYWDCASCPNSQKRVQLIDQAGVLTLGLLSSGYVVFSRCDSALQPLRFALFSSYCNKNDLHCMWLPSSDKCACSRTSRGQCNHLKSVRSSCDRVSGSRLILLCVLTLTKQQLFCLVSRNFYVLSSSSIRSSFMSAAERSFGISMWRGKKK